MHLERGEPSSHCYRHLVTRPMLMQLYDPAMKFWVEREDIRNLFLFRPDELHIVFQVLSALGKYIEGSGIDQAWVEAGLYSPTTVTNILNGKQIYRSLGAYKVTLITLYNLYFHSFWTAKPEIKAQLHRLREVETLRGVLSKTRLYAMLSKRQWWYIWDRRHGQGNGRSRRQKRSKIQHFILNYMKQFETILHFIWGNENSSFT